jgi:hypothetical protein
VAAILGGLMGVGLASGVIAVALIAAGRPPAPPPWSSWHPTDDGIGAAQQIADHVGRGYRLPDGQQLVAVRGGPLTFAGLPARLVLRSGSRGEDFSLLEGKTVIYALCGAGPRCSIKSGKPSHKRHVLLRREAFELALYSFRYLDDVDMVAAFLPAAPGSKANQVVLFRGDDVKAAVHYPLARTLSSPAPSTDRFDPVEQAKIDELTGPRLYTFDVEAGPGGEVVLILNPIA